VATPEAEEAWAEDFPEEATLPAFPVAAAIPEAGCLAEAVILAVEGEAVAVAVVTRGEGAREVKSRAPISHSRQGI
jgi:hypothetical protein